VPDLQSGESPDAHHNETEGYGLLLENVRRVESSRTNTWTGDTHSIANIVRQGFVLWWLAAHTNILATTDEIPATSLTSEAPKDSEGDTLESRH
jgi:hypothetical protein